MKKKVIDFFNNNSGSAFKNKEIAKRLNIRNPNDYIQLKSTLHQLQKEEFLSKKAKRYQLNRFPDSNKIIGKLYIHADGYGFVSSKNKGIGDIYVTERDIGPAFDGDIVEIVLFANQKGKNLSGQVIKVIERKRSEIVGTLHKSKSFYFVRPDDTHIHRDIYIEKSNLNNAKEKDKVVVSNIVWDSAMLNPEGTIIQKLGKEGSIDAEIAAIAKEFSLPFKFTAKALNEANKIDFEVTKDELKKRLDLRRKNVFTIDPVDAKDFDDALSIEQLKNGNLMLGVHIADVSYYVQKDSALDRQANLRGNSIYLVGQVIPMLPEKLSNEICSLIPNTDRYTFSVMFELTRRGKIVKYDILKSIINSKRRFTYEEVQEIIEGKSGEFSEEIILLNNLAQKLREIRIKKGSIEFTTPEIKFELSESGKPMAIFRKELKDSNMLVEEFMLLANKTIAEHFSRYKSNWIRSFVYRVHDRPDKEKVVEFSRFIQSLGYSFNENSFSNSKEIQRLISEVKNSEEEAVINELAIRSMAKAVYATKNIRHFGLGFKFYSHFTSPIRRYSDLITHRLVYSYINDNQKTVYSLEHLKQICDHISATERIAIAAERQSVKIKQVEFLKNKIGEKFHAVVSGVTHYGIFIKITDILAEGLIRVRDLEGDFYVYDEKKYSLIGQHSKKRYRLGDKLLVRLVRVDVDKLELDFKTIE